MGQPHLYGPDMPQTFFVAFDLLAIASIGIALQNKCKGLFFKNMGGGGDITFGHPKLCFRCPKVISPPPPPPQIFKK